MPQEILAPGPLQIDTRSYQRGTLDGEPCLVVYNSATDETTVVAKISRFYANAMAALEVLDAASTKIPLAPKKTIIRANRLKTVN